MVRQKSKILGMILAVVMLIAVFTGCSASTAPKAESQSPAESSSAAASQDSNIIELEMNGYKFKIDKSVHLKDRQLVMVFENISHPFGKLLNAGV